MPRHPVQADAEGEEGWYGRRRRLVRTQKALTWKLKKLRRVQDKLNLLEKQLRETQTLELENDAETITAACAKAKSEE